MPVHTARRNGQAAISIRYTLMSFHIILWAVTMIFAGIEINIAYIILFIQSAFGLALLVYIPAAIALTRRRSKSHFDHAGGEVAYLVFQQAVLLTTGVLAIMDLGCPEYLILKINNQYQSRPNTQCVYLRELAIPCFIHLVLLFGWMSWIIVVVYRAKDIAVDEAFQVPVHRLLRGMYGGEDSDVDLMEASGSTVRPFEGGRGQAQSVEMRGQGVPLMSGTMGQMTPYTTGPPPRMEGYTESDMSKADTRLLQGWRGEAPPPYAAGDV